LLSEIRGRPLDDQFNPGMQVKLAWHLYLAANYQSASNGKYIEVNTADVMP
jgi:hypothetical protein